MGTRAEPVMGAVASKLSGTDPSAVATRNGTIGFFAALGFLSFVGTFNERVQSYKAAQGKNKRKTSKIAQGLDKILRAILSKTCNMRELMTVLGLSLCLLLRTLGSVWVAKEWGEIVGAIVTRNWQSLLRLVSVFTGGTMSLAVLNAYLKYYISLLKENVREKMTYWCHKEYLKGNKEMIFYKANKVGDEKIENCDHQITSDVDKFAELFASVLSQSLKPIVDFLVYSVELSMVQGLATPLTLYGWFAVASMISTITLPPFGMLAAQEQQLDGQFPSYTPDMISTYFVSTWKNMEAISTSIQDLFELTNRIGKLSGLASRVHRMMCGLEKRVPVLQDEIEAAKRGEDGQKAPAFEHGKNLKFDEVSIYKPDGTLLARDLNFEIQHGDEQVL